VSRRRRALAIVVALAVLLLLAAPTLLRHLRAAALLTTYGDPGATSPIARFAGAVVDSEDAVLEGRGSRVRVYRPRGVANPAGIVLLHGVHRLGIDEPRLVRFARAIAGAGYAVMTPEIEEIAAYRIEPRSIDTIGLAARDLRRRLGRRPGLMGMSFAGGLALLAAADARYQGDVAFTVAVGAHDDLARVARFFAHDRAERPDGGSEALAAHPYGVLVLVYSDVAAFFDAEDVESAREAIHRAGQGAAPRAPRASRRRGPARARALHRGSRGRDA
jgi:dienelactone hydrolase